jgi:hypothetical protein
VGGAPTVRPLCHASGMTTTAAVESPVLWPTLCVWCLSIIWCDFMPSDDPHVCALCEAALDAPLPEWTDDHVSIFWDREGES